MNWIQNNLPFWCNFGKKNFRHPKDFHGERWMQMCICLIIEFCERWTPPHPKPLHKCTWADANYDEKYWDAKTFQPWRLTENSNMWVELWWKVMLQRTSWCNCASQKFKLKLRIKLGLLDRETTLSWGSASRSLSASAARPACCRSCSPPPPCPPTASSCSSINEVYEATRW